MTDQEILRWADAFERRAHELRMYVLDQQIKEQQAWFLGYTNEPLTKAEAK